jgi:hypothetical protein
LNACTSTFVSVEESEANAMEKVAVADFEGLVVGVTGMAAFSTHELSPRHTKRSVIGSIVVNIVANA